MYRGIVALWTSLLAVFIYAAIAYANPITWDYSSDGSSATLPGTANIQGNLNVTKDTTVQNLTVNGSANLPPASINCASLPGLTGDVTTSGCAATIAPNVVTPSKLSPLTSNSLLGNPTGASANPQAVPIPPCSGALFYSAGSIQCNSAGQYPGTNTGVNANAGNVGEILTTTISAGLAVNLTSGTTVVIGSLNLTAGRWDCAGVLATTIGTAGTANQLIVGINATTTLPATGTMALNGIDGPSLNVSTTIQTGPVQLGAGAPLTIYLLGFATYATGGPYKGYGQLRCKRIN